jgi:hypothetical protein
MTSAQSATSHRPLLGFVCASTIICCDNVKDLRELGYFICQKVI